MDDKLSLPCSCLTVVVLESNCSLFCKGLWDMTDVQHIIKVIDLTIIINRLN